MLLDSIEKAAKELDERVNSENLGNPFFNDERYNCLPFSKDNFVEITPVLNNRKIAFVDGGNMEIVSAPNFSVQLVRIAFVCFKNNERIMPEVIPQKIEFFSVCHTSMSDGRIIFGTKLIPLKDEFLKFLPDEQDLVFDSNDPKLRIGDSKAEISRVSSIPRRFAEWKFAEFVIQNELESEDILLRDGSLQTSFSNESKYSERAYLKSKEKNVFFIGLSKTSNLYTDTGYSLISAVSKIAIDNKINSLWFYQNICSNLNPDHNAEIFCAKLNKESEYSFRIEILREQAKNLSLLKKKEIFFSIADNSKDISFVGYPYGLLSADLSARVSRSEKDSLQAMFFSELAKIGALNKIIPCIKAVDAHDLLNKY